MRAILKVVIGGGSAAAMLLATALAVPAAAGAASGASVQRTESPVITSSPITSVVETVVHIKAPLPAADGPRPAACDWLGYLRFRDAAGPADYTKADKIFIAQPGIFEGAGAFDSVARNTIVAAAKLGKHVEFWALDRRSNCLEDHTGIEAGLAAGNDATAFAYYYGGKAVNGKTFAGYQSGSQVAFLGHVGLAQTEQDEYSVMTQAFPSQPERKQKFLCGGHSLGGTLTGYFAEWDFDGNPATTADAGYNQCSGYFALDTSIATSLPGATGVPPASSVPTDGITLAGNYASYALTQAGLTTLGIIPTVLSGPALLNPEMTNLLSITGLAADLHPSGVSDLGKLAPRNFNVTTTLQLLLSKDALAFALGNPNPRSFNITNDGLLGALLDDNSQPLGFLQSSVGFFSGGPVAVKNFPLPSDLSSSPLLQGLQGLVGTDPKAIPTDPNGPLYTWLNYNQVGTPGAVPIDSDTGKPFTSPGKEVTDINELARSLSEQPLDFTEDYFPTKIITDLAEGSAPQITAQASHTDGIAANPQVQILGGDGLVVGNGQPVPAGAVVAPGYNHLDVLTAAAKQNNGLPEPVSTSLAAFAAKLSS